MILHFDRTGSISCEGGIVNNNNYVKVKFYRQYYGEIQCSDCGADLMEGFYWLNVGNCTPFCIACVEGKK